MYNVTVSKNLELDQEQASNLVGEVLMADFDFVSREINSMKNKTAWMPCEVHDWNRSMEVRDAMKVLLSYYLTMDDYNEFMELQRVYGNVR